MTEERLERALEAAARRVIEEAKAIDAAEDEAFGDARGDELPAELADRAWRACALRRPALIPNASCRRAERRRLR